MTAAARRLPPASHGEEVPLCPTGALGHALATSRGRWAPLSEDVVDAALARVFLAETRWAVASGRSKATERERAAMLAGVIARVEHQKRAAAERDRLECMLSRPLEHEELARVQREAHRPLTPQQLSGVDRAVAELRNLGFDLWASS